MADIKEHIPIGEYFDKLGNDDHTDIVRSMCRFNYNMGKINGMIKGTIYAITLLPTALLITYSIPIGAFALLLVFMLHTYGEKYIDYAVLKIFIPMFSSVTTNQMYNEMLDFVEIFKAVE